MDEKVNIAPNFLVTPVINKKIVYKYGDQDSEDLILKLPPIIDPETDDIRPIQIIDLNKEGKKFDLEGYSYWFDIQGGGGP